MKKWFPLLALILFLAAASFGCQANEDSLQPSSQEAESSTIRSHASFQVDGVVKANQQAFLVWRTTGRVAHVNASFGEHVRQGETLAVLNPESLAPNLVLAQAELIQAERDLAELQNNDLQRAKARQAVEEAEHALEDARHPEALQAEARQILAQAQDAVDGATMRLAILTKPPPQQALDQAQASLVMAENALRMVEEQVAKIQQKAEKPESSYAFWESGATYRKLLRALEIKLVSRQIAYQEALARYNNLQLPPDPLEVSLAEAELAKAQAELEGAQREWDRVEDGFSPGEIAVLEARLEDATREYARLVNGPDPDDILVAQARVAAAQALLTQARIEAPFTGMVTEVRIARGDLVSPGLTAFRIDDLSLLLVEAPVSEIDIPRISVGQEALLTFEFDLQREYHGRVISASPVGDTNDSTTTFTVLIEIRNPDEKVKPGMTSRVIIPIE